MIVRPQPIVIPCKDIVRPKLDPKLRTLSKATVEKLAQSIKSDGLLHPVGVRPRPDGKFDLIFGLHRVSAVQDRLKRETIPATVFSEMTDSEAEWATHAENLWRSPLTKAQQLLALRRWAERYEAEHPGAFGPTGAAGGRARASKGGRAVGGRFGKAEECALANDQSAGAGGEGEGGAEAFNRAVAATTGVSERTAKKMIRTARNLDPEQIKALDDRGVGKVDMEAVAAVRSPDDRAQVVGLIASGLDAKTALAKVAPESPAAEPALSDQEWLEQNCSRIRERLGENTAAFDASALFYRHTSEARAAFRNAVKSKFAALKGVSRPGFFVRHVTDLVFVAHPKDWNVCGACSGSGQVDQKGFNAAAGAKETCGKCRGDGFRLRTEMPK